MVSGIEGLPDSWKRQIWERVIITLCVMYLEVHAESFLSAE